MAINILSLLFFFLVNNILSLLYSVLWSYICVVVCMMYHICLESIFLSNFAPQIESDVSSGRVVCNKKECARVSAVAYCYGAKVQNMEEVCENVLSVSFATTTIKILIIDGYRR